MRTWLKEWLLHVMPSAPTRGLHFLYRHLRHDTGKVIRGDFTDEHGNGCLVEWLGRHHVRCRGSEHPGVAFMTLAGIADGSAFVEEWDKNPAFRTELLKLLSAELRLRQSYRRVRRSPPRKAVTPCCS